MFLYLSFYYKFSGWRWGYQPSINNNEPIILYLGGSTVQKIHSDRMYRPAGNSHKPPVPPMKCRGGGGSVLVRTVTEDTGSSIDHIPAAEAQLAPLPVASKESEEEEKAPRDLGVV